MKYIDTERLRKEVKRFEKAAHKSALGCADSETRKFYEGKDFAYQYVGILIDSLQQEQDIIVINKKDWEAQEQFRKNKVFGKPLQQEQPNRPDFDDVDPNNLVHSHYTKVREIKTGKEFWAEYSTESAEWYEAGTGNAYSISDVEIVKEQQEVDLEKVVMIDNVIMNMTAEGYNKGYKTRPFYEEVLRRFNARKE